jgi:hypothetical protein
MSMSLHLVCIEGEGQFTFSRAIAREILSRGAVSPEDVLEYRVDYPDGGGGAEVYCEDGVELNEISFNRFGGETFFDRVWELADRIGAVIFWPAPGPSNAVTRTEVIERLPSYFREEENIPVVVHNGRELYNAIEESFPPVDRGSDDERSS